jgi:hypothetical protein
MTNFDEAGNMSTESETRRTSRERRWGSERTMSMTDREAEEMKDAADLRTPPLQS